MNEENNETLVYQANVKEKKGLSIIWILPLIVAGILAWVAYESYMKKGTNIEVIFKSAEGLKAGVTPLEYKGLQIGKVTNIELYNEENIKVNILVNSDVAKYVAVEGSKFWIQKPEVSLTKISGLNTLISGYKIELAQKNRTENEYENVKEQLIFKGLDSKPQDKLSKYGYYISLISNDKENLDVGTPVFYNKFQIGEVVSKNFKFEKIFINIYIYDKFNYLVNKSSKFIMNEALNVKFGASGLSIEFDSLYSAVVGGITVQTPNRNEEKIARNEVQPLYDGKEDSKLKEYFHIEFENSDGIDVNTPIIYKGITVGKISNIELQDTYISTKAYVYEKYRYLLTNNTKFHIEKATVSIDGVKNLGNIIKGNFISLEYKRGEYNIRFKVSKYSDIEIKKDDTILTLYSDNLNSISKKSKVYYKNIVIGRVIDYGLNSNFKKIKIKILIDKKYSKLLNDHILFYDMSSKLVEMKSLNLNINYNGVENLLNGGIGLVGEKRKSKLKRKIFKLYDSYKDVEKLKKVYNDGFIINAYFKNNFEIKPNMSIIYKNQEIGFVKSIQFRDNESKAKLFIYKSFKKFIDKRSSFYKKGIVNFKASLNGVIFEVDNFTSLLEGSIHLERKSNIFYDKYQIFSNKDSMKNYSNSIKILFDNVEGLKKDFSQLTYKGVNIGKVSNIKLKNSGKIEVTALIYDNYKSFSKKGTIFYLKKPIISLQEIKNVGSAIMAVNIGIIKSNSKKEVKNFIGYDKRPSVAVSHFGTIFKVIDKTVSNVNVDAPIYYKNVEIGKINNIDLSNDGSKVIIDCLIYNKYTKFIRKNSVFYDISGFNMKFSLFSETQIESSTVTSLLKGGLEVVTPYKYGRRANSRDIFILKKELRKDWKKISPSVK